MDSHDYAIRHFECLGHLALALKALPAEIQEHRYSYEAFGSWSLDLRYKGSRIRVLFDGRDKHLGICKATTRQPPFQFDAERSIAVVETVEVNLIETICRAIVDL